MKKQYIYSIVAALTVLFVNGCSGPEVPVNVMLEDAYQKAETGDWTAADKLAANVLKREGNNVNALILRAMSCSHHDEQQKALDYAIAAANLKPNLFLAQYLKGQLLYKSRKYDLAQVALKAALKLRPNDQNTLILLAQATLHQKQYMVSATYFARLAKQNPQIRSTSLPWNGIGICYARTMPTKAKQFFRQAEKIAPYDPVTSLNLAVFYDRYNRNRMLACQYYQRFIRLSTGKAEYDMIRGSAQSRLDSISGN